MNKGFWVKTIIESNLRDTFDRFGIGHKRYPNPCREFVLSRH